MTHFERLGLPVRFALDEAELERGYLSRSRQLHPDFHQLAATAEQRASMELTAALNEAYATLKQPFLRAEYLLSLFDGPSATGHKNMAAAFLEEMLDLRMEIEELRGDRNPDSPARRQMAAQLGRRRDKLTSDLASRFEAIEIAPAESEKRNALLREVRETLNAAKYIQGLLRDLKAD